MITIISYNLAADISLSGSSCPLSPGCGVVDRGKSKDLQKNPFGATTTTNKKLNPCICDCRSSNRTPHIAVWERALSPPRHFCSPFNSIFVKTLNSLKNPREGVRGVTFQGFQIGTCFRGWVNYSKLIKGQNASYFSLKIPGLSDRKLFLSINIAS